MPDALPDPDGERMRRWSSGDRSAFEEIVRAWERPVGRFLIRLTRNPEVAGKSFGKVNLDGVPYPGTVLVGTDGKIAAKLFVDGYKERHSVAELVAAAEKLKK